MKYNFNNLTNEQLFDIAIDDTIEDVSLRIEAVKHIEDESVLMSLTEFTILDEADEEVVCEAVRRIKSQEAIAKIANDVESLSEEIRSVAVCMLTDERMLADFAKYYGEQCYYDEENLGVKAVEKITDPELLKEIINDDGNYEVVCGAADKLNDLEDDKSVIERAALNSSSSNTRTHMASLITNQSVLKEFIINDNEVEDIVKFEALEKIIDEIFLKDIILSGIGYDFGIKAINKITDQTYLKEIVIIDGDYNMSIEAINKITDQLILRDIILSKDVNLEIKAEAINKITEQSILKDIVLIEAVEVEIKVEAVKKITNSSLVKEIMSSGDIPVAIKMEINDLAILDEETLNSIDLSDSENLFDDVD